MKTGFWLRGGNGKLAGATVYQSNGETVMREIVAPSNPNTEKQIIQRIFMHTCGIAYSVMKEICDHSFESIKKGRDTMAYFMKQNLNICRDSVASMQAQGVDMYDMYNFSPLGNRRFVANQYQIAMGSLPQVRVSMEASQTVVPAVTTNSYQAVIDSLGLQRGDQLTFVMIVSKDGIEKEFKFARVILDPTDPATGLQLPLSTALVDAQGKVNMPSFRNEGEITFGTDFTSGLVFYYKTGYSAVANGVIVSRLAGDSWLRSTTYLAYATNDDYSLGECIDRAKQGGAAVYSPSEQYLNNAGVGAGGSEASIDYVTVGGSAAVVGTPKAITAGETSVVVALNNATSGTVKIVEDGQTAATVSGAIGADGKATLTLTAVAGKVYNIVYNLGGNDVTTGYSISASGETPPSGGGGFGG